MDLAVWQASNMRSPSEPIQNRAAKQGKDLGYFI